MSVGVKAEEFTYNDLYGGSGAGTELPDFAQWHYFAFDETQGVILKGKSAFEIEGGSVGTEKINTEWQARTDWDFAFHAYDIRTNSGLAGNGNAGAIFIADAASAGETSLSNVYASLTEAPLTTYNADAIVAGNFYLSLATMPPSRATSLSVCAATRKAADGASADFSSLTMQAGTAENPMIIVLKTTSGKYVKIYLKQFVNAEGKPGFLKFDYEFIPQAGGNGISVAEAAPSTVYVNAASKTLHVSSPESAEIAVYNLTGSQVKRVKAQPGNTTIPVS
ncbi:MAG: HmuY family protein, partial [Dysgonamonadaceae bacterium]|nr:HmuY family protein [Dysgonamonadaceae bacterium]